MRRDDALALAARHFDSGDFTRDLARRVAIRTESQDAASGPALQSYLADEIGPTLAALGFTFTIHANPEPPYGPLLVATRHEGAALPTVLMYGHGDVIRGQDESWTRGQGPWQLAADGDRLYGRGTADNKGQHSINIAALAQVLAARERPARLQREVAVRDRRGDRLARPGGLLRRARGRSWRPTC